MVPELYQMERYGGLIDYCLRDILLTKGLIERAAQGVLFLVTDRQVCEVKTAGCLAGYGMISERDDHDRMCLKSPAVSDQSRSCFGDNSRAAANFSRVAEWASPRNYLRYQAVTVDG